MNDRAWDRTAAALISFVGICDVVAGAVAISAGPWWSVTAGAVAAAIGALFVWSALTNRVGAS